ncbi:hypothetical protein [Pseudonocardia sp. GCM10023141]|uniref:hypothetical protein n=1 Tax=Pseudonocardia sp. GCM10023141 TaxID=3252653 RepID=UPI003620A548
MAAGVDRRTIMDVARRSWGRTGSPPPGVSTQRRPRSATAVRSERSSVAGTARALGTRTPRDRLRLTGRSQDVDGYRVEFYGLTLRE